MKFDLRKKFHKLLSILAISEIILVDVVGVPVPRPFGELSYLDPVAAASQDEPYGARRSNKRVALHDDSLTEFLAEGQEKNLPRQKRIEPS